MCIHKSYIDSEQYSAYVRWEKEVNFSYLEHTNSPNLDTIFLKFFNIVEIQLCNKIVLCLLSCIF
jgi:hypothetical protein